MHSLYLKIKTSCWWDHLQFLIFKKMCLSILYCSLKFNIKNVMTTQYSAFLLTILNLFWSNFIWVPAFRRMPVILMPLCEGKQLNSILDITKNCFDLLVHRYELLMNIFLSHSSGYSCKVDMCQTYQFKSFVLDRLSLKISLLSFSSELLN